MMSLNADIASVTPIDQGDYLGNPTYNIHPNTTKHMTNKPDSGTLGLESSPRANRPLNSNPSFGRVGSVVALPDNIDINSLHGNSTAVKLPVINNR